MVAETSIRHKPASRAAEEAVIGAILLEPRWYDEVCDELTADDFYYADCREIYVSIAHLKLNNAPVDAITVAEHLQYRGIEDHVRPVEIASSTFTCANTKAYAQTVRHRALERRMFDAGSRVCELAFSAAPINEKLSRAQEAILQVGETQAEELISSSDALRRWLDVVESRYEKPGNLMGVSTGFSCIDARTNGLQASDLIVVGARPSQGKTTYALNIAEHVAMVERKPVLMFSLEMGVNQLYDKLSASASRVPLNQIRRGELSDSDWDKVSTAVSRYKDTPLYIDERSALHVDQVQMTARRLHRRLGGLALIIIDYLQLMRGSGYNREAEISSISRGLKALAKSLNIPILVLSQLSRRCEQRDDKRPIMSDLRDSGGIEQDADIIQFLYRDEYYNPESERAGIAEIITAKFRNGETGTDFLQSRLECSKFIDFTGDVPVRTPLPRKVRGFNV